MAIDQLLQDKDIKAKQKTGLISTWLLDSTINISNLISYAQGGTNAVKGICIEAIEFATKQRPTIADDTVLDFVIQTLTEKAARIKWESARVIGNTIHLFPAKVDNAIANLLENTDNSCSIVRWSSAYALGQILKLKTSINTELIPTVEAICQNEEKNSIKKIYLDAIKSVS